LLDLAQVAHPGTRYDGKPIEPLAGLSLLPVLMNPAQRTHTADEAIGYELAGSKALFKGDLKLVNNLQPVGDGHWHLYDLHTDPGETRDLQQQLPQAFSALQADYEAWSKSHGVLDMPAGYNPVRQVLINSFFHYWYPYYKNKVLAVLAGLLAVVAAFVVLRRRRRSG
jgi:arylsulfatase/uncharacterized sulfatase